MDNFFLDAVVYLVRGAGQDIPFAVVAAFDREDLFKLVDENADPHQCEVTLLREGEGVFYNPRNVPFMTEGLEDRFAGARWEPLVNDDLDRIFRARKLAKLEKEAADLGGIFQSLKRKANDRFNRHRRRA